MSMYQHTSSQLEDISLSFFNISYQVFTKKERKLILDKISGHVPAGSFLAILGPSGAGKSSLLDLLAGRDKTGRHKGTILINGQPRTKEFVDKAAYVMQDDVLLSNLTVTETLQYTLDLRIPKSQMGNEQRKLRIESLLADLNLTRVRNSRVGNAITRGISGGERRRLSIATEMVTGPNIVFLDEPTTGLDSHNALRVMTSLKGLCRNYGVTIICTVHQPRSNIFRLFDNILLMEGGQTIYFGGKPIEYFANLGYQCPTFLNPADFLLDIILKDTDDTPTEDDHHSMLSLKNIATLGLGDTQSLLEEQRTSTSHSDNKEFAFLLDSDIPSHSAAELKQIFNQSDEFKQLNQLLDQEMQNQFTEVDSKPVFRELTPSVSKFVQTRVLLSRTWKGVIRDSNIMYVRTIAALLIALLVGFIFFQLPDDSSSNGNRMNSILFLMCVFALFCLPAISKFIEERVSFTREHANGLYSTLPYCIANFVCELPILVITVVTYGTISYWMVGFQPGLFHFTFFLIVVLAVIQVGYCACQVIASLVKTVNMAIALYVLFLVYSLLLGGFLVRQDTLPEDFQWLVFTSYFYYGYAALTVNEFEDKAWGPSLLQGISLGDTNKYVCCAVLLVLWVVLKIVEYFCLRFVNKEKR